MRIAAVGLYGEFGRPLRFLLRWLFAGIYYPPAQIEQIQALAAQGTVVYVTRGYSSWLTLAFCHVLHTAGLPDIHYLGGIDLFWHRPWRRLGDALGRMVGRRAAEPPPPAIANLPPGTRAAALAQAMLAGRTAFIMLPVPRSRRGPWADWTDYLQALIAVQQVTGRPIFLVPHVLTAREQAGATEGGVINRLFGDSRRPGWLRHWAMLLTLRHGIMRMSAPVSLQAAYAEAEARDGADALPPQAAARRMRHAVHRALDEEERVVAGPRLTAFDHLAREVLRSPIVRAAIAQEAERTGRSEPLLEVQSEAKLKSIASRYDVRVIKTMEHVLYWIFNRIYDGINVDEAGLGRVIEAARRGPLVFCPSHKSHVDYLVLSYVLWTHGIAPPHIAAGANLSFFPLGALFRRCGAFFLRRSFRDDPLYGAVLRAYIGHLVGAGASTEFFLEGSRSRTGKLLQPKYGLLSMFVHAWRHRAREDVVFVPVSIDYERIIEAPAYSRELGGADKRQEDIGGLLRSTRVLRSRYGRMQVQFGAPVSMNDWAQARNLPRSQDPEHDSAYRAAVERLGYSLLHDVAMVCSVTPTSVVSIALLSHPSRGMAQGTLIARSQWVMAHLEAHGGRFSEPLVRPEARLSAVLEAVHKLVDEKLVVLERVGEGDMEPIFRATDESRVALDYHKNAVMNYFAAAALVCRALLRAPADGAPLPELIENTHFLSQLLKLEFIYRDEGDDVASFHATLASLEADGLIRRDDAGVHALRPEVVGLLAGLLDSFVQAYAITARTATELRIAERTERELTARVLERARRAFLEGSISRPESASRTLVETALAWLVDAKMVRRAQTGKRRLLALPEDADGEALGRLAERIETFL